MKNLNNLKLTKKLFFKSRINLLINQPKNKIFLNKKYFLFKNILFLGWFINRFNKLEISISILFLIFCSKINFFKLLNNCIDKNIYFYQYNYLDFIFRILNNYKFNYLTVILNIHN